MWSRARVERAFHLCRSFWQRPPVLRYAEIAAILPTSATTEVYLDQVSRSCRLLRIGCSCGAGVPAYFRASRRHAPGEAPTWPLNTRVR